MSKRFLRFIVALITISVLGLVSLQVYFLTESYAQQKDDVQRLIKEVANQVPERVTQFKTSSGVKKGVKLMQTFGVDTQIVKIDTALGGNSVEIRQEFNMNVDELNFTNTDSIGKKRQAKVIALRADGNSISRTSFNNINIENTGELMDKIMQEVMIEVLGNDEQLSVDSSVVASIIDTLFEEKGINVPFEFRLYNTEKDSVLYGEIPSSYQTFSVNLFPKNLIPKPIRLDIGINQINTIVLRKMSAVIIATLLLAILFIGVSWSSVYIMFRQKKLSDVRRDFLNNMTHEFKTPISTIHLATSALNSPQIINNTEKIQKYSDLIAQENNRMLSQVESILTMAVTENADMVLKTEDIVSTELIENCVRHINSRCAHLNYSIEVNEQQPFLIHGDKLHIENSILNILENALKYGVEGNHIQINIDTEINSNFWTCHIQDNGPGISREHQKRVFDKFYRVPTGDRHDVKGFGIGLSYVKNIVNRHKGTVVLKSDVGKGSTFSINLPIEKD